MQRSLPKLVGLGLLVLLTACPGTQPPPDTEPPAAPTGVTAEPGDGQVTARLDSQPGAGPRALQRLPGHDQRKLKQARRGAGGNRDLHRHGLANGTTYFYALDAEDETGNASERSEEVAATPEAGGDVPPQVVSSTPADGEANVALNASITLAFSKAMDEAATQAALSLEPPVGRDGVALAAIQGLYQLVQEQQTEILALKEQLASLEASP